MGIVLDKIPIYTVFCLRILLSLHGGWLEFKQKSTIFLARESENGLENEGRNLRREGATEGGT